MEKRVIFLLNMLILLICFTNTTYASTNSKNNVEFVDGMIKFSTIDTKAYGGIRWKTVGFTVTTRKCLGENGNGGYPTKYKHIKFSLDDANVVSSDIGNGKVRTNFTIPESKVTKSIIDAGFANILMDGGIVYLNGIFQVVINDKYFGDEHDNLNGIKYAQAWSTPDDFNDRFDVPVIYHAAKHKVTIKYIDEDGRELKKEILDQKNWKKPGEVVNIKLNDSIIVKDKTYSILTSYITYDSDYKSKYLYKSLDYGYTKKEIMNISTKMRVGGITVYAVMTTKENVIEIEEKDNEISFSNYNRIRKKANLCAENYGDELFEIEDAIPSGEKVYFDSSLDKFIYSGKYKRVYGKKTYKLNIKKKYILKWTEKRIDSNGRNIIDEKSRMITLEKSINVERAYSFWKIDNVAVYYLDCVNLKNEALDKSGFILRNSEKYGDCNCEIFQQNMKEPAYDNEIILDSEIIDGGEDEPPTPTLNFRSIAENAVEQIKVRNDELKINDNIITTSNWSNTKTNIPVTSSLSKTQRKQLRKRYVDIPVKIQNGLYKTNAKIEYKKVISKGFISKSKYNQDKITVDFVDINNINVFTPVVCDGQVSSNIKYCQKVNINHNLAQLVLGKEFYIQSINEGVHIGKKGYYYGDFKKYSAANYVRFSFDVISEDKIINKNTWIKFETEKQKFTLPIWVEEGDYTIDFKTIAYNYIDGNKLSYGYFYNSNASMYGAKDSVEVQVSGRIFGFNIYDISDYPLWKKVFRKDNNELRGINYTVGRKDENGNNTQRKEIFTLPVVNGSHPLFKNKGMIKPGYSLRMNINTIGNASYYSDYIRIKPKFYIKNSEGKREEVDVFYEKKVLDKNSNDQKKYVNRIVKIGSKEDDENVYKLSIGDKKLSVENEDIENTKRIKGYNNYVYRDRLNKIYSFGNIMINKYMQVLCGQKLWKYDLTNINNFNMSELLDEVCKSGQKWYFEYHLPANIFITKKDAIITKEDSISSIENIDTNDDANINKDIDINKKIISSDYLILNFSITTVYDGEIILDYENSRNNILFGACNMWKMEGMCNKKTDSDGNQFEVKSGDVALVSLKESVATDYVVGGTH